MQNNATTPDHHENEHLRFSLNAAGIGIWDLNPISNEVKWDEKCRELFGFSSGESIAYKDVLKYIHPEDAPIVDTAVQKALNPQTEGLYEVRYRIQGINGDVKWILSKGRAYFNEGVPYRFAGIAQDITETIKEREKTEASEKIAQLALENSNSGYFHLTLETGEMEYSAGYARIVTGNFQKGLNHISFIRHIHPDDIPLRAKAFETALETGKLNYEGRTIWSDGTIHWMRANGTFLNDASGKPYQLSGTIYDTTAEHLHNEAVKEAEDMLSAAFNNASVGMAFADMNGRFLKVNPAYASLLGYSREELLHLTYRDITHPDDLPGCMVLLDELVADKRSYYNLTKRYIQKDGNIKWVQVNITRIAGNTDRNARLLAIARDISLEKENERALAASESMFKNVTNSAPTGLWLSDEHGGLVYLNKTLVEWTGIPYNSLLGSGWINAIVEEDREKSVEAFMNAINTRTHYDVLFRLKNSSGEACWWRSAGDPYYNDDGNFAGYAGFCMDIHELVTISHELTIGETRFRSIVEQAPMAIGFLSGADMVINIANEEMFKIWGKDKSVIGMPVSLAIPALNELGLVELLKGVYNTGKSFSSKEVLIKQVHNGITKDSYFDFSYTPLKDAENTIAGVMVLATSVTEQVMARKSITESEDRFRSLIEEAPVATCLFVGREMKIEVANSIMLGYWGKDSSIIGMPLAVGVPELIGQPFLQILDDIFTSGQPYEAKAAKAELLIDGVLGTYYFDFTYKPVRDVNGEIYGIIDMAIDVTEEVIARKKMEESELFSRSIIENSPVAKAVLIGREMIIRTVNEKMQEMLGYHVSMLGRSFIEVMGNAIPQSLIERMENVLSTGITYHQSEEKIELIKNGSPYTGFYNYIYKALRNTDGEIYGILITATEVTDHVLARQKIEEAESALRGAIELAELGTWSLDLKTGILDYSERLRNWFGIKDDEVITIERAYKPIKEADKTLVSAAMLHAITPGTDGQYDVEYTVNEGILAKERILHAQGRAFHNAHGEVYKVVGTAQDVTTQRKIQLALEQQIQQHTEELQTVNEELTATNEELTAANEELYDSNEQLMRSNEELAQFAYVASHDLQEPLRKIMLFSEMLENQFTLSAENKLLIGKIAQSTARMSMLIRDLLEFSRLLKSEILMKTIDLNKVIKEVVVDFELTIEEKKVIVNIGDMPVVEAVGLQMNQLFYNLLSNALKFTKPGVVPLINISARHVSMADAALYVQKTIPDSNYYHITFSDNGIGFEVQYSEQIFEIFKRLHGRGVYPGSGIGLALCRRIVANHNGHLYAESQPGNGSVFHIIIPDRQYSIETIE